MPVPEDIRRVERPVNTVVVDKGTNSIFRYAVRERVCVKYVRGGNPQPRNGKVIGHIIDKAFVPVQTPVAENGPNSLSWGASALVHSVSRDVEKDLMEIYNADDAYRIMAMAFLRIIKPGITNDRMPQEYKRTFVSVFYGGISFSPSKISKFQTALGQDLVKRQLFFARRMERVAKEHHIIIDGTLKQDTSEVNDLSAFSYKGRVKGTRDISVIYAYDLETMEPICSEVFPGNCIDASAYKHFIRNNDVNKGIIIADKGFPPSQIAQELQDRPDLHFLTPIKRNDTRIKANKMTEFTGVLEGVIEHVVYKKVQLKGGRFLYAFKDNNKAKNEENGYLEKAKREHDFNQDKYAKKCKIFGLLVLESDLDLKPIDAYLAYLDRWKIELLFDYYKNGLDLDITRAQSDFSVIGSEFVNHIATLLTSRIINKARNAKVFENTTYKNMMDDLSGVWRKIDAIGTPKRDDESYVLYVYKETNELMEALDLQTPPEAPKPEPKAKKEPDKNSGIGNPKNPEFIGPKRPRGRPRKYWD